jgi:mannose-6-phosphate isomerase-like protein (cupin superfamily)
VHSESKWSGSADFKANNLDAMRTITSASRAFVPAGHESPLSPGVLKKVLLEKADLQPGRIQMVNWASLGAGKRFAPHYHEDMQEIFIVVQGQAEITVAAETATLRRGDAVVIDPREVHQMRNAGTDAEEYLAIGITSQSGGKTVVVEE